MLQSCKVIKRRTPELKGEKKILAANVAGPPAAMLVHKEAVVVCLDTLVNQHVQHTLRLLLLRDQEHRFNRILTIFRIVWMHILVLRLYRS